MWASVVFCYQSSHVRVSHSQYTQTTIDRAQSTHRRTCVHTPRVHQSSRQATAEADGVRHSGSHSSHLLTNMLTILHQVCHHGAQPLQTCHGWSLRQSRLDDLYILSLFGSWPTLGYGLVLRFLNILSITIPEYGNPTNT